MMAIFDPPYGPDLSLTSWRSHCNRCGAHIPVGSAHSCKPVEHPKHGWQCPVCGTVYAPTVTACHNSHPAPTAVATGANDG